MRNFHQIGQNVQVFPIMHAVMRRKDLWNLNNARTATPNSPHREANDIWLRYCDVTPESTVESVINDHKTHCFPAWSELPEEWHMLYFAANHGYPVPVSMPQDKDRIGPHLYRLSGSLGSHAIIINKKCFTIC